VAPSIVNWSPAGLGKLVSVDMTALLVTVFDVVTDEVLDVEVTRVVDIVDVVADAVVEAPFPSRFSSVIQSIKFKIHRVIPGRHW